MSGVRIGSLFSGYGGLDIAAAEVFGGSVSWHCEVDRAAVTVLGHHWPEVPNLGDITAVDWTNTDRVDVLTGGFPCQDISSAGKQRGIREGTRSGLWSHMATSIDHLRPRVVLVENVRGLLNAHADSGLEPCPWCVGTSAASGLRALGAVLGDLADLGYDARWCGLRAADVGAPHGRYRIFLAAQRIDLAADPCGGGLLGRTPRVNGSSNPTTGRDSQPDAHAEGEGRQGALRSPRRLADRRSPVAHAEADGRKEGKPEPEARQRGPHVAERGGDVVSDAIGTRLAFGDGVRGNARAQRAPVERGGVQVDADTEGAERRDSQPDALDSAPRSTTELGKHAGTVDWGPYSLAIRRWERVTGRTAPYPTTTGRRGARVLNPMFVEWLMGLPSGHVTGLDSLSRNEMLRLLGNGVVPQQAAHAFRILRADDLLTQEVA